MFDLGGIVVMHDASGCTGNYTSYDEPRWLGSRSAIFCSGLRRMDAVMGNDDKFIKKTIAAANDLSPTIIAYLGSPVPMVIGTDLNGMAAETEYSTGIPSFGFNTTGQRFYDKGASDVFTALIKRFAEQRRKDHIHSRKANILGLLPIDLGNKGNCQGICDHIASLGYEDIQAAVSEVFDFTPSGIIRELELRKPVFAQTSAYGHFGRPDADFTWERTNKVSALRKVLNVSVNA